MPTKTMSDLSKYRGILHDDEASDGMLPAVAGSPSSTPETDAAAGNLNGINLCAAFEIKCRQLEQERNELRVKLAVAEREAEKWKAECKRQWNYLSKARHNARAIQNIRWEYRGNCGAVRLANIIEEDCHRGMISPENAEVSRGDGSASLNPNQTS